MTETYRRVAQVKLMVRETTSSNGVWGPWKTKEYPPKLEGGLSRPWILRCVLNDFIEWQFSKWDQVFVYAGKKLRVWDLLSKEWKEFSHTELDENGNGSP